MIQYIKLLIVSALLRSTCAKEITCEEGRCWNVCPGHEHKNKCTLGGKKESCGDVFWEAFYEGCIPRKDCKGYWSDWSSCSPKCGKAK